MHQRGDKAGDKFPVLHGQEVFSHGLSNESPVEAWTEQ
jgi:hypothetical protein